MRSRARSFLDAAASFTRFQTAVVVGMILLLAVGGAVAYLRSKPKPVAITGEKEEKDDRRELTVHVAGAVVRPAVYHLPDGSRVTDAIQAAGGTTPLASLENLNLASKLKDGQKVLVPEQVEAGQQAGPVEVEEGPVNVNTADAEELETLPGLGPALAGRIVDYRTRNGPFQAIEELEAVEGIGPKKLEAIKDLVSI